MHYSCTLLNVNNFLSLIFKLVPFFLNIISRQGGLFFIGLKFILLKWFYKERGINQQKLMVNWKGGDFSKFFYSNILLNLNKGENLSRLPIAFIFLNFDNYLVVFNEISKFNLPVIGLFQNILNPRLIYSFGDLSQSFFINCFFFKLFSRLFRNVF